MLFTFSKVVKDYFCVTKDADINAMVVSYPWLTKKVEVHSGLMKTFIFLALIN